MLGTQSDRNEYLQTYQKDTCYGCGGCEFVCPTGAIRMTEDRKGFSYPQVDVKKCVNCGRCREVCIHHITDADYNHTLYAVQNRSQDVLEHCQSGGLFDALSDVILVRRGRVYGAVIMNDLSVEHIGTDNVEVRNRMRGSKYVASRLTGSVLKQIETDIVSGREVLFSGAPCQCALVNKLYGKYDNLYTLDFICHGTPSQKLYKDYLKWFEEKMGVRIASVFFRIQSWKSDGLHTMLLTDSDGNQYFNSDYAALFYSHLGHRESCLKCRFANKNRQADITMGGFLDRNLYRRQNNQYDVSMCIVNTEKGARLFELAKDRMLCQKVSYQNEFRQQPCLYAPVKKPERYDEFWEAYMKENYKRATERFVPQKLYAQYHLVDRGGVMLTRHILI